MRPYKMVRGLCPRDWMRGVVDAKRTRRDKRGQNRSSRTSASNAARQSRNGGASRTPPPTAGRKTKVAGCDATGTVSIRPQMVRGRCPRDLDAWGCGRETDAPEVTRVQSVKPNVCV